MPSPTSRRVALATGLAYHVLEWSADRDDAAHTVLLLHGFLDFAWSWDRVVQAGLGGPVRILAPDLRGHGDSDWIGPGGYYHFLDYLADVHDLVGQLVGHDEGAGRLSIVGHSMGGSVAAYYAGTFPERVHRLALLEGLGPPEDRDGAAGTPDRVRTWIAAWRRVQGARGGRGSRGYPDAAAAAARLRDHDPLLDEEQALWLAARGAAPGADGLWRFKHDPLHMTPGPLPYRADVAASFWGRVRCPTLLVEGEASAFRHPPEEHARRAGGFAAREEAVLPGAGHMMQRHQPAALARLLRRFLVEGV
jgi:pimeloyl-ACP methyl ester carboxylesterase